MRKILVRFALIAVTLMMTVTGCDRWYKGDLNEHNTEIAKEAIEVADRFLRNGDRDRALEKIEELYESIDDEDSKDVDILSLKIYILDIMIGTRNRGDDDVLKGRNKVAELIGEPKRKE